jgi:hypothetical protein
MMNENEGLTVEFLQVGGNEGFDDWTDPPVVPVEGDHVDITAVGGRLDGIEVPRKVTRRQISRQGRLVTCYVE